MTEISPFLKWVGGKRWLTANHDWLLPDTFNTYVEPFLGGGAVLFHLQPDQSILSDANADLIACYKAIKKDWRKITAQLERHQRNHDDAYYYRIRSSRFSNQIDEAARFIYLNRACFNGIYRVNLEGNFNVPKGSKQKIVMDDDDFRSVSRVLRKSRLLAQDFETTIELATANDFIFVDPPYTVKHNNNGFIKYNQQLFAWSDQIRLREAIERAANRGALILLTNADHQSVRELYRGLGRPYRLDRASVVSAQSQHRRMSSELVITIGYDAEEKRQTSIKANKRDRSRASFRLPA
ncbi:Dam family site-specific DNA-(adenine-N6)-methyltransferase [Bradyrhizobium sp. Pear77]|uniref:DNA adenine methylase n=1 Tax=Bradyrhizobium altum TaxID=1571202 RepID=UPI00289D89CF|nr:Dam family site-specific DNA-(adenine-N6)-methyltransferase [Bradyrhizobium altum]MCC8958373.1 Dam family site-specific DNA-(adenine-N6)-methyltransferase [Bradyrhizobium altum]